VTVTIGELKLEGGKAVTMRAVFREKGFDTRSFEG